MMKLAAIAILFSIPINAVSAKEFTQEIRISRSPEVIWNAIVNPAVVKTYHFAPLFSIDLKAGGKIIYGTKEQPMILGTIQECVPNIKLSHTFQFEKHPGTASDAITLVTYEIRNEGGDTILKLTHSGFAEDNQTYANVTGGWPVILDRLKHSLEKPAAAN